MARQKREVRGGIMGKGGRKEREVLAHQEQDKTKLSALRPLTTNGPATSPLHRRPGKPTCSKPYHRLRCNNISAAEFLRSSLVGPISGWQPFISA